ncbi:hypothetical protein EBR21_16160, partial [bacterium]|nr:hypothetical protein [bacterium]
KSTVPQRPSNVTSTSHSGAGNPGAVKGHGQSQGNIKEPTNGSAQKSESQFGGLDLENIGKGIGRTLNTTGAGEIRIGVISKGGGGGGNKGNNAGVAGLNGVGGKETVSGGGSGKALVGIGHGDLIESGNGVGKTGGKIALSELSFEAGDGVLQGSLSSEEIQGVIRINLAKIKACYEQRLQIKRGLQGRVVTKFVISASGGVSKVTIGESDLPDIPTETCISKTISRWIFPKPRGSGTVTVVYPFVFTPSS